jgi:uncharacterized protein (TIGR00299 family) protein
MSERVVWLDCSAGVSGDMLLAALDDLGALDDLDHVLSSMPGLGARLERGRTTRGGLDARQVRVVAAAEQPPRRLADLTALLDGADVPAAVADRARRVLGRLADAEAAVHGTTPDEVHFHEVGAVDTVVDVVGACLGLHILGVDRVVATPVARGGGTTASAHGRLPVPPPAVLRLLESAALSSYGGPVDVELATPTGVAVLAEVADGSGPMPAMSVLAVGTGAGSRDVDGLPNVLRAVVGTAAPVPSGTWLLLEANVDDLDPRLWAGVLDAVLSAGAADAWLTPILMKKGRPAHTLSALVDAEAAAAVRTAIFRESSTIGLRESPVGKHALDRTWVTVDVDGQPVRVKMARLGDAVVNASPEWEDVAAAAKQLDRPAKVVLAEAIAAVSRPPAPGT